MRWLAYRLWTGSAIRRSHGIAEALCLTIWLATSVPAAGADVAHRSVWLHGIDPVAAQHLGWPNPDRPEYVAMFSPDAPWAKAAQDLKVFKITAGVVLRMPDHAVSGIFDDLKRRHIGLAIEMGLLAGTTRCGVGVEGYAAPQTYEVVARKIKALGGKLDFVAMDEPLWFAHRYAGPNACHASVSDIAHEVGTSVAVLKSIFPDIKIGDIEPVGNPDAAGWLGDIADWLTAYRTAVGEPLPFFHADVVWAGGVWREQLPELAAQVRQTGIRFGIIYNGDGEDQTDEAWAQHAEQRFEDVEVRLELVPDDAILQSWMPYPLHMLPETQHGTMTNLVDRYVAQPTLISAQRNGGHITGKLATTKGQPLVAARLRVSAIDNALAPITDVRTASGAVPQGAVEATIAIRINTECQCSGQADLSLGSATYVDDKTGQQIERTLESHEGQRIQVGPGEKVGRNARTFSVIAGDAYTVKVPMQVSYGSAGSGYVAIIFLDAHGVQVGNQQIWFKPSVAQVGNLTTDGSGEFILTTTVKTKNSSYLIEFEGDDQYRYSRTFVQ